MPMKPSHPIPAKFALMLSLTATLLSAPAVLRAAPQHTTALQPDTTTPHRTRLILKDGSYQIVMSYKVVGKVVRYVSAERGGAEEEIPLELVDMDATQRWERQHAKADPNNPDDTHAPAIDPELLKEEADRAALTPEVAKDLRLPEGDSTLVLDTYRGTAELDPLAQTDSDLNRNTAHNLPKPGVNPLSASHQIVQLKGEKSPIQLHIKDPVLYLRIGDETVGNTAGAPFTVDSHGAS